MSDDPMDLLWSASSSPSCKFAAVGDMHEGIVLAVDSQQQTDVKTGEPLTWRDGRPRMQFVVTLQTQQQQGADDDGVRRLYARGRMLQAIAAAVREAGVPRGRPIVGGKLRVKFVGEQASVSRGMSPAKLYRAWYRPAEPEDATASMEAEPEGEDLDVPF